MQVYLATYGCQANERDSETILGMLEQMGYRETKKEEEADLILLNTCSIREKAEQKVFSYLGTLKQYKQDKPGLIIGLCGCMAQEQDMIKLIRRRAPQVDLVLGTHKLHRLPEMIRNIQGGLGFQWDQEETGEIVEALPAIRPYPFKALINITYGCNNFCTYCIVPYVRGRERSRRLEDILSESRQRVEEGAVELMYLGQNVNSYGKTLKDESFEKKEIGGRFANLLYRAQEIEGLERIRYMTSHPRDFGDDLIQAIADCPKVSRHIHLPVQSGSSRVLRQMNRGYSREDYLALVERIRRQVPQAVFTTDIIVGFPGETEEDLQDTLDLLNHVGFDSAFTFMYSPRQGTPAANLRDQLPLREKKARLQAVMAAQANNSLRLHQDLIGQRLHVLAESWDQGVLSGRADGNQLIHFPGEARGIGAFHQVEVKEAQTWTLKGEAHGQE